MQLREAAAPVPAQETAGRDSDKPFEGKTAGFRLQGLQGNWGVSQNCGIYQGPRTAMSVALVLSGRVPTHQKGGGNAIQAH